MPKIAIYHDYIFPKDVLYRFFCNAYGRENVRLIDAQDILTGALDEVDALVLGEGADLYYCEKLNGEGNQRIRQFVENGGAYLGICAGAYYACRAIEWAREYGGQAICGPRELAFIDMTARGPVPEFLDLKEGDINMQNWSAAVPVRFGSESAFAFYRGGPRFFLNEDIDVVAQYDNFEHNNAAIVRKRIGKGCVVLSAVHFEYDAESLRRAGYHHNDPFFKERQTIISMLDRHKESLASLQQTVLEHLFD